MSNASSCPVKTGHKLGVAFVIVLAWIGIYFSIFRGIGQYGRSPAANQDWQVHSACGVMLESPGAFKKRELNLGPAKKTVEEFENRQCDFPDLVIGVMRIKFRPGAQSTLEMGAKTGLASMMTMPGVKVQHSSAKPATISGRRAMRLEASYTQETAGRKRMKEFVGLWVQDGRVAYWVSVDSDTSNPQALKDAARTLDSVKLAP